MMLDHLDDPGSFTPGDEFRQGVQRRGRHLRRRHRVTVSAAALLVVAVLAGTGFTYVDRRDAAIDRVRIATQPSTDGTTHEATNVLLVGADEAPGDTEDRSVRADTMVVVRFEADGSITSLSLPRDLWDDRSHQRIDQALTHNLETLVEAVTRVTGIPIDHVVELDFAGFKAIVDEVGNVRLRIETDIRDRQTGLDLAASPCTTIDGTTALALIRSRHLEYRAASGEWLRDGFGDFGRMARAQALLGAAIAGLAQIGSDPVALDRFSRILADHAVLDERLSLTRMVALGHRLAAAGPARTTSAYLPVSDAVVDGAQVLRLAPGSGTVLHDFGAPDRGDPPVAVLSIAAPFAVPIHDIHDC
jgi:LCP family protein required for cell wall assembly